MNKLNSTPHEIKSETEGANNGSQEQKSEEVKQVRIDRLDNLK